MRSLRLASKIAALSVAIGALLTVPASADGDSWPSYGPRGNWAGLYAGGHLGVAFLADSEVCVGPYCFDGDDGDSDFFAGLQVGYNWQNGATVYGIEGDISFDSDLASIRGRYGWVMPANYLLYGTAGIAFSDVDFPGSDDVTGLVIGAGAEFDMARYNWRNVTAGVEALYYFLEADGSYFGYKYEVDADVFALRGRVNYHFQR